MELEGKRAGGVGVGDDFNIGAVVGEACGGQGAASSSAQVVALAVNQPSQPRAFGNSV